ncbi:hypothetical protein [Nocardia brasiliensis]|uniref:hypothetical protein n=1 Tax=Nocardia brasiliensis TaxID=37326 RepID=UPI003CC7EDAB
MTSPTPRLDDLIDGIKKARPDNVLDQLSDAVVVGDHLGEGGGNQIGPKGGPGPPPGGAGAR